MYVRRLVGHANVFLHSYHLSCLTTYIFIHSFIHTFILNKLCDLWKTYFVLPLPFALSSAVRVVIGVFIVERSVDGVAAPAAASVLVGYGPRPIAR